MKASVQKRKSGHVAGYLFAAPGILGFLIFTAGPMIISLYYSFYRVFGFGCTEMDGNQKLC